MENELNKWIAEVLFEGCWHDWRSMGPNWGYRCGKDCGKTSPANYNPDYCNDLNLASLAEAKAIELARPSISSIYVTSLRMRLGVQNMRSGK